MKLLLLDEYQQMADTAHLKANLKFAIWRGMSECTADRFVLLRFRLMSSIQISARNHPFLVGLMQEPSFNDFGK